MQAEIGCTARLAARWDVSGHLVIDLRLNPLVEECSRQSSRAFSVLSDDDWNTSVGHRSMCLAGTSVIASPGRIGWTARQADKLYVHIELPRRPDLVKIRTATQDFQNVTMQRERLAGIAPQAELAQGVGFFASLFNNEAVSVGLIGSAGSTFAL